MLAALTVVAIAGTFAYSTVASGDSDRGRSQNYEVSITNITKSQILSPAVVATHSDRFTPLFTLGSPASAELAGVAEDAMVQPLIDALNADPTVSKVELLTGVNGPILPGETATITIKSTGNSREISCGNACDHQRRIHRTQWRSAARSQWHGLLLTCLRRRY